MIKKFRKTKKHNVCRKCKTAKVPHDKFTQLYSYNATNEMCLKVLPILNDIMQKTAIIKLFLHEQISVSGILWHV